MNEQVVVAVDGGGSKTDAAVVTLAGRVLSRVRGPGCSHHRLGVADAVGIIDDTVQRALVLAGEVDVQYAGLYVTGIDMPHEQRLITDAVSGLDWLPASYVVDNDVLALLRAGTDEPDACVVVCGTGINGAALSADGRTARVLSLGDISGDWGGGSGLIEAAVWHAARAADGRGPATELHDAVLKWTGADSMDELAMSIHMGTYDLSNAWDQVPDLMAISQAGDPVARRLIERQADEIVVLAASLCRRVGLEHADIPLVLGGGIATSGDPYLNARIEERREALLPNARIIFELTAPVAGSALLALGAANGSTEPLAPEVIENVRLYPW